MTPWEDIKIDKLPDWQIASARAPAGSRRWWAWGKMGQIQGGSPLDEPGKHVWACYGETRQEAIVKLKQELGLV